MTKATIDPCVLIRSGRKNNRSKKEMQGLIILKVDESLALGDEKFQLEENQAGRTFKTKSGLPLGEIPITSNGVMLTGGKGRDEDLPEVKDKSTDDSDNRQGLRIKKAIAQYIGVICRPEIVPEVHLIAPGGKKVTPNEFRTLVKVIKHLQANPTLGLTYIPIDLPTSRLVIFTDVSLGNAKKDKSQLIYLVILADSNRNAKIIHFESSRCQMLTR